MKKLITARALFTCLAIAAGFYACKKDHHDGFQFNVSQVNLVADTEGYNAAQIDTNLVNAWGMAVAPSGPIWVSANHAGVSTIYDNTGKTLRAPVTIPSATAGQPGAPTGQIFNSTTDFGGNKFIFAGEDGTIAAWSSGSAATIVANRSSSDAVYKGITMAAVGSDNFLYVANFKGGKIDVYDKNFNYVADKPFADPDIPAGFGPFNIQNIEGKLYVTYAKLKGPDNEDDEAGPGNGFVDIFNPDGSLIQRFASHGSLNSPWGIALAPAGFADAGPSILIGNFGDGKINVFDTNGSFKGQLRNNGKEIAISGLWAIDFLKGKVAGGNPSDPLYFTAGPEDESHGLFGYLKKQ